jgi:hypothetical protein
MEKRKQRGATFTPHDYAGALREAFPWMANPPKQTEPTTVVSTIPKLTFSVTNDKILTLDNSRGSELHDFQITALEYYMDPAAFSRDHAIIAQRNQIGGDLDFTHFDLKRGEIKHINFNEGRYRFLLKMNQVQNPMLGIEFESQLRYICLRFKFLNQGTGETFIHYLVMSPFVNGFDLVGHPEGAGGSKRPGEEGFPYSIARVIKENARLFYGTEYHEYQP